MSDAVSIRTLGQDVYVLTDAGDVWRSTDLGSSWSTIGTLSQVGMVAMTRDGDSLVVATKEGEVASSADGVAWTWRGTMNQLTVTAIANDTPLSSSVPGALPPPTGITLAGLWPNPQLSGAGMTTFSFQLARAADVALVLYDVHGRRVARHQPQHFSAGSNRIGWNPGPLPAGSYFVRLTSELGTSTEGKLVVLQ